jgi:hypothetical protein
VLPIFVEEEVLRAVVQEPDEYSQADQGHSRTGSSVFVGNQIPSERGDPRYVTHQFNRLTGRYLPPYQQA